MPSRRPKPNRLSGEPLPLSVRARGEPAGFPRAPHQCKWLLALVLAALSVQAEDWPAYRSDNHRSGYAAASLPVRLHPSWVHIAQQPPAPAWPPPAKRSYWQRLESIEPRVTDDWTGHPVAAGDAVYFGSSADDHVYCLDADSGQVRWLFGTDGPVRYAPTVADGRVFFGSDDGRVYCVDARTGRELWNHRLAPEEHRIPGNGRIISAWPVRTGVLVGQGALYALAGLYPQQGVYACALDIADGRVLWKREVDFSPEGYLLATEKTLFVPTGRSNPVGLDRASGEVVRRFDGVGGTYTLVTDEELVAGRGNTGELAVSNVETTERLASFAGKHLAVTPRYSYLLSDTNLVAIDRARYRAVTRSIAALSKDLAQAERRRRQSPNAEFAVQAQQLSRQLEQAKAELPQCRLWDAAVENGTSLAATDNVVAVGGREFVALISASDGALVWRGTLDGTALGLAVAGGRLLAATEKGDVHCFSASATALSPAPRAPKPVAPASEHAEELSDAAAKMVSALPNDAGFCLALGAGSGRLAYEIARQSRLRVVIVDSNAALVDRVRRLLRDAGVYGSRVAAHVAPAGKLPFTDYCANLVVSEPAWLGGAQPPWPGAEIDRVLRPFGGVQWLRPGEEAKRRGTLDGAGEWTHQFGNPGNTSSSGDRLVQAELRLQWFGGPGPRPMVDRHLRAPAPLSAGGRLFIPAENGLIALDAYNGTELWQLDLPGSQRYSMPYDAGYLSIDGDTLAVAVRDSCWIIEAATGRKLREVPLPADAGPARHWGYVALRGNKLFGTVQKESASRTTPSHEQIDRDYNNDQPLVTGERLFCVDLEGGTWQWQGGALLNPTLTLSGDRVFFVESRNALGHSTGRVPLEDLMEEAYLVALDAKEGSLLWERPLGQGLETSRNILYLACDGERLVGTGSFMGPNNDSVYRVACYDPSTGQPRWQADHLKGLPGQFTHGEQVHHPVLLGSRIVTEPVVYDAESGRRLTRGQDGDDWRLVRPGHSCGTLSAAGNCLFFRANNPTVLDLASELSGKPAAIKLSPSRTGCWINIIPAAGLVLIPEASSGCVCHYSLQTSMAFLPRSPAPATSR